MFNKETSQVNKLASTAAFEWIDILRGLAAVGIVLFHSRVDLWVGWNEIKIHPNNYSLVDRLTSYLSTPLPFLGTAVMLFFILSGFCIHYPFANSNKIDIKTYSIRRLVRIVPPYWAAVFVTLFVEFFCHLFFRDDTSSIKQSIKTLLMVQNYPPNPGQLNSNPSLWSLPVEVELYFAYPVLFYLNKKYGIKGVSTLVLSISILALGLVTTFVPWMKANLFMYLLIWCLGAGIAEFHKEHGFINWNRKLSILLFVSFGIAIFSTIKNLRHEFNDYIWAFFYFFIVIRCLSLKSPQLYLHSFFFKILTSLGKISFSLYLIHFPIFYFFGKLWVSFYGSKPSNIIICFIGTFITIMISHIFYTFIELPFHNLARTFGKRKG